VGSIAKARRAATSEPVAGPGAEMRGSWCAQSMGRLRSGAAERARKQETGNGKQGGNETFMIERFDSFPVSSFLFPVS
jgi:hypothetical protein